MSAKKNKEPIEEQQPEPNTLIYEDEADDYGYVHLSKLVLYAANLSKDAKILYAYLRGYAYEKDHCFPGYPTLAKDLGTTRKTVIGYMKELEVANLIYKKRRGQGKTNIYVILSLSKAKIQVQEHHRKSRSVIFTLQEGSDTTLQEVQNLHPNNEEVKELKSKEVYPSNIRKAKSNGFDYVNSHGSAEQAPEGASLTHNEEGEASQIHSTTNGRNIEENEKYKHFAAAAQKTDQMTRPAEPERKGGLAHISQTVQVRLPMAPSIVPAADARDAIEQYLRTTAVKLHDEAPLKSSITRAFNLYERSGVDFSTFYTLMYDAEKEALHHTATIKKLTAQGYKNRMAYFFAILEDKLGLRERPLPHTPVRP